MQQITKKQQHDVANNHQNKWFSARKKNAHLIPPCCYMLRLPEVFPTLPLLLDQGTLPRCLCLQASAGALEGRSVRKIQVGQTIANKHTNLGNP